ncbi:hypothetical protein [Olivibacter sitiensis]|uniref:hypothetical protein n=1 Tax=Olivibacter sitiensis TaxID=376470 RepID=UPI0003F798A4|nr:hypothetical protein [Olivibacter sitiensis]
MLFSIQTFLVPVSESEHLLENPLSRQTEQLWLVIYQEEVGTAVTYTVSKRLRGAYFTAEGQEIPSKKWTKEMQALFNERKSTAKLKPSSTKVLWRGWLMIIIGIIAIGGLSYSLYDIVNGGQNKEARLISLKDDIESGDLLFGYYFFRNTDEAGYGWVRVAGLQGTTLSIQFSSDKGNKSEKPGDYSTDSFDDTIYEVSGKMEYQMLVLEALDSSFIFRVLENAD